MARDTVKESLRTFLAFPLAEIFLPEMTEVIESLKPRAEGIKWVLPKQVHITLHFFGETSPAQIQTIHETITPAIRRFSPIKVALEEIGFFPNAFRPRVIWIGISGDVEVLIQMQQDIEISLKSAGFAIEDRPFHAHATLGRIKHGGPKMQHMIKDIQTQKSLVPNTNLRSLNHIVLFKSLLSPQGPYYEAVETFYLSQKP